MSHSGLVESVPDIDVAALASSSRVYMSYTDAEALHELANSSFSGASPNRTGTSYRNSCSTSSIGRQASPILAHIEATSLTVESAKKRLDSAASPPRASNFGGIETESPPPPKTGGLEAEFEQNVQVGTVLSIH
jgi:hypothetical protein